MRISNAAIIGPDHQDYPVIKALEDALVQRGGGIERIRDAVPKLIRRAIDEVIDAPRTGRLKLDQIEKTEKTYIGTKIEILIRDFFGLPKGILDLAIDGVDVDIKNTIGNNWMIPDEAIGKPCVLIASDEKLSICQFGLFVCRTDYLTAGANKDNKRSIRKEQFANIHWLLLNEPYPPNFWESMTPDAVLRIMSGKSGNERIVALFRDVQKTPVHRNIIQAVAQQKDYMKRLRKNGGARDQLAREMIAVFSGIYDAQLIEKLGLPKIGADEFIALTADTEELKALLRSTGHID